MKKRILALFMSAAMALSLTACSKSEGDEEPGRADKDKGSDSSDSSKGYKVYPNEGDFEVEERDDGVAIIQYYYNNYMHCNNYSDYNDVTYTNTNVDIPPTIGGKKVVEICRDALRYGGIENITIPESVTKIGQDALPYTWIEKKLEEDQFVVVNGILVGARDCSGSVTIPKGVKKIADYVFFECTELTSITLPEGLTEIGEGAFFKCTNLESVTLPEGLTKIGVDAFGLCESLTDMTIPKSVNESIGAFAATPWYENKSKEDPLIIGSVLYNVRKCSGSYTIPAGVTKIADGAFSGCTDLTSVVIPEGVTTIGYGAFFGCTNLSEITFPKSVTEFDSDGYHRSARECDAIRQLMDADMMSGRTERVFVSPFEGTAWLENKRREDPLVVVNNILIDGTNCSGNVTIPDGVKKICDGAFCDLGGSWDGLVIESVTIPDSVTEIGKYAFCYNVGLKSVNFPKGKTKIGTGAFANCSELTSVTLPDKMTSLGLGAFYRCEKLTSVDIPDGVTLIGLYTFQQCYELSSVKLPDSVTRIGGYAFNECVNLASVNIPDSVTVIDLSAFQSCGSLADISLGKGVVWIGEMAFSGCHELTSITIPDSATRIGCMAFSLCENLASISLGKGVTEFVERSLYYGNISPRPFGNCSGLTSIDVADKNPKCCSVDGILFQKEENGKMTLVACPRAKEGDITLPDGVTEIGESAFNQCGSLTSITIPEGVTKIGNYAFNYCESLTSVNIPDSVTELGGNFRRDKVVPFYETDVIFTYKGNTYDPEHFMVLYNMINGE